MDNDTAHTSGSDSLEEKSPYVAAGHPDGQEAIRIGLPVEDYPNKPTEEELDTLRRVPGSMPYVAYAICAVEFAERASYYGVQPLITNFVNKPLPAGGNGWGAVKKGTQDNAGALGLGSVKASAVSQSFSMLAYALPLFFGWLADSKTGRFKIICYGVAVFGVAHILMVGATAKTLLASGAAVTPYFLSVYILAIGAGKHLFLCVFTLQS
jgi:dipeptide/tripeptide permease